MRYSLRNHSMQRGFTLIEMLVVAPLVILLIGVMIGYISNLTGQGLQIRTKNAMIFDTQTALDDIETNASKATGYLTTTGALNDTPKQGSDNSSGAAFASVNGGNANTLIFKFGGDHQKSVRTRIVMSSI